MNSRKRDSKDSSAVRKRRPSVQVSKVEKGMESECGGASEGELGVEKGWEEDSLDMIDVIDELVVVLEDEDGST